MALVQDWKLQGTTATTIDATDSIAFSNGTFGQPIQVGSYNDKTHVRTSGGTDKSASNSPHNTKYLTSTTMSLNGGASANLSTLTTANSPLKITVSESVNITVTGVKMYAYDGTTTTNAPSGMNVYLAEQGDTAWVQAHGSGSALELDDHSTAATSHDFYVAISASPTSVGVKSANKLRLEFVYQ